MEKIVLALFLVFGFSFANLEKNSQKECVGNKKINDLTDTIYNGNFDEFVKILNKFPNLINCRDVGNLRPLDCALVFYIKSNGDKTKPFFEFLVQNGADLNYEIDDTSLTPFQRATEIMDENYLMDFFNKYKDKIDINLDYNNFKVTLLTQAHDNK
ncbi:hypothetical protein CBLAS_0351 [Campylobacter blaseri]|uniref:Ankyrin repeat domain-containing protein n=1 Tax=Campylobacter blaseri TaxID=2042961 RepID=A0A2P8R1J3_9BACT|nr:hypothetical protein [Campylobacter blaseri]PSM52348.1 hypothetical protein CQ405_04665 [Campylobacter blaseri]PSM54114.1 hypothetical protein CRN67_04665 [Campylobacter blaseri]QKF85558.1 hypothetical protein CBLAS_0351 [Campylobacter blaseri]